MPESKPRTTQFQLTERREKVYHDFLKGLSGREIKEQLSQQGSRVDLRTVYRDIEAIQKQNQEWYKHNSTLQTRMERIFKQQVDAKTEILKEAWRTYYLADKPGTKTLALSVALNASRAIDELMGFAGMTPMQIELQQKMEVLDAELKGLRELASTEKSPLQH